jgi:TRAP-type mannitol/chloroaromatic compound transport system permease small subunit
LIGGATVVFLVGLTVVSVIWRYLLNDPIFGVTDISRMCLAVIVMGSLAYGARRGAFVRVDILAVVGGRKVTRYTDIIVRLFSLAILALATYSLREEARCGFECGEFTDNLEIVHTPFYWLLAVAMGTYLFMVACELVIGLSQFGAARDPFEHE